MFPHPVTVIRIIPFLGSRIFMFSFSTGIAAGYKHPKPYTCCGLGPLCIHILLMVQKSCSPVEVGSFFHYLQGFIHPRWCRISFINSISHSRCLDSLKAGKARHMADHNRRTSLGIWCQYSLLLTVSPNSPHDNFCC